MYHKFIITLSVLCFFCNSTLRAQQNNGTDDFLWMSAFHSGRENNHEFSFHFGSGFSALNYNIDKGRRESNVGLQFGVEYRHLFSQNWSFSTGVELALYKSVFNLNSINTHSYATDFTDTTFIFQNALENYKEKQQVWILQIPLMLTYTTSTEIPFYFGAGLKLGFPLRGIYTNSFDKILNSGYYEFENAEYNANEYNWLGFGEFSKRESKGNLNFNMAVLATVEAGFKFEDLGSQGRTALYVGLYVDWGLNNIAPKNHENFVDYFVAHDNPRKGDFVVNSVLASTFYPDTESQPFTKNIRPGAFGIKLRVAFGR